MVGSWTGQSPASGRYRGNRESDSDPQVNDRHVTTDPNQSILLF